MAFLVFRSGSGTSQIHIPTDSYETKTSLYRSGRKKTPLDLSGLKKNGSQMAPGATNFRAPSECYGYRRTG
jgi:hypothetical protein